MMDVNRNQVFIFILYWSIVLASIFFLNIKIQDSNKRKAGKICFFPFRSQALAELTALVAAWPLLISGLLFKNKMSTTQTFSA